jgi:acetyl-CoA synthetase
MEAGANVEVESVYMDRRVFEPSREFLMGRIDDVYNASGNRLGMVEVESALVLHEAVAESIVVGFPHELEGRGIYAFVTLKEGFSPSDGLRQWLIAHVRKEIGPIAAPDWIQFARVLPKTRSGIIMRRTLQIIAEGKIEELGDISKLDDAVVVKELAKARVRAPTKGEWFSEWF